ncbi:TetR/AcrR family transcriptional regulator [Sphingobacterium griseoflavum]|uniref:HTH tetR-type domain-containing protein n=1 Tax=Sphingobacterium griseoflavum TaxID=1474952 RepID=A0ABQ3HVT8_9SPHI|nr:TetR/AcrR family transcriptional regulator [Sphingobacterium griseoflavum]GHE39618.1 hypothetical protein GCM10017764_23590 [Sphingobacterium griseoflavum]
MLIKKKQRKEVSGPRRNKARTIERLLTGIGTILEEETFTGLSVTAIYKKLRVNPKLVYLYFDSFDKLVSAFVQRKLDAWELEVRMQQRKFAAEARSEVLDLMIVQLEKFQQDGALQKLIHWSLVEKQHKLLKTLQYSFVHYFRTLLRLFTRKLSTVERKRVAAALDIMLSGVLFLSFYNSDGRLFCGVQMVTDADRKRIYDTFRRIILGEIQAEAAMKLKPQGRPIPKT